MLADVSIAGLKQTLIWMWDIYLLALFENLQPNHVGYFSIVGLKVMNVICYDQSVVLGWLKATSSENIALFLLKSLDNNDHLFALFGSRTPKPV